jgi:hypothetical protein
MVTNQQSRFTMTQLSENITLEQLADHDNLESLWIAVRGHGRIIFLILYHFLKLNLTRFPVYDLTTFSTDHPGGVDALQSSAGTDGTEAYEYAGHSDSNMAKMQQYRVGALAGSHGQASVVSHNPLPLERRRIKSLGSRLKELASPRLKRVVATISVTSLVAALFYQRRDDFVEHILPAVNTLNLHFQSNADQSILHGFWAGVTVASLAGCVGINYLYKLFLSTLDYQNDVFGFPPTIPRKAKR